MKRLVPLLASLLVLCAAVYLRYERFPLVEQLKYKVFDAYQQQKPREYSPLPVKIIDIDDESLERFGQWPWPRTLLARLMDKLGEAGTSAIAFDVVFAEPDRTSPQTMLPLWGLAPETVETLDLQDHDSRFAEAIGSVPTVTGFVLINDPKHSATPVTKAGFSFSGSSALNPKQILEPFSGAIANLPALEQAASGNGSFNSSPDEDGIIRRIDLAFVLGDQLYPSLAAESLRVAQGAGSYFIKMEGMEEGLDTPAITNVRIGDYIIPTDARGKLWLYYSPYRQDRYIPAWQVLEGKADPDSINGHILFLGTSAQGLRDIRATPLDGRANGVEVHAQAVEQILSQTFLKRPDIIEGLEIILTFAVGALVILVVTFVSALWGALFMLLCLGGALGFSWFMFAERLILIEPVYPSIAILLVYFTCSLGRFIATENEKKQIRHAFSHYMSPAMVEKLAKHPESLRLGGEMKELTMLFCDIRGFTTLSEQFDAVSLTRFINRFLTPMTDIILSREGTIDKYMGDCIMAFWNAPIDDSDHATHAAQSALTMVRGLTTLNETLEKEAQQEKRAHIPIQIGIGLNTGTVCVGNMGSDQRFDYSVLGDSVNLASRLEGQSKTYGVDIVIGEATEKQLGGRFATLELDRIRVKGKREAVTIYALLGDETLLQDKNFTAFDIAYRRMLTAYRAQRWNEAKESLNTLNTSIAGLTTDLSALLALYGERIAAYEQTPPGADWDGVYEATSK